MRRTINISIAATFALCVLVIGASTPASAVPGQSDTQSAPGDGSEIVGTETDAEGRIVLLREGTYNGSVGFGWSKIQQRHGILSKNSIGFVLKSPDGGLRQGEDLLYTAYANEITCDSTECTVTDDRQVRVVNKSDGVYASYYGVP